MPNGPKPVPFWERVNKTETCWLWLGARTKNGYGNIKVDGKVQYAHRVAYEEKFGPLPAFTDRQLDHLCRVRNCVNPDHLELVTHRENVLRGESVVANFARQETCVNGHPFDSRSKRQRVCLVCHRAADRRWARKRKMELIGVTD